MTGLRFPNPKSSLIMMMNSRNRAVMTREASMTQVLMGKMAHQVSAKTGSKPHRKASCTSSHTKLLSLNAQKLKQIK